jgi:hypothetical protein
MYRLYLVFGFHAQQTRDGATELAYAGLPEPAYRKYPTARRLWAHTCSQAAEETMMRTRLLFAAVTLGAVTLIASIELAGFSGRIVHAAPPVRQVFNVHDTHPAPAFSAFCGFPIQIHEEGRITDIFHTDNAGNFVMESLTSQHYIITMSNVQTGAAFSFSQAGIIMFKQTFAFSAGVVAHVTLPGQGVVFLEAGPSG